MGFILKVIQLILGHCFYSHGKRTSEAGFCFQRRCSLPPLCACCITPRVRLESAWSPPRTRPEHDCWPHPPTALQHQRCGFRHHSPNCLSSSPDSSPAASPLLALLSACCDGVVTLQSLYTTALAIASRLHSISSPCPLPQRLRAPLRPLQPHQQSTPILLVMSPLASRSVRP